MRPSYLLIAGIASITVPFHLSAADRFWDINGQAAGAGGLSPSGVWDTLNTNWNLAPDGTSEPVFWDPFDRAVFAAGTDATGAYELAVSGTQFAAGVLIEEGSVALSSGTVSVGSSAITVSPGATLSINSSARVTGTVGSTLTLNGGTIINTNPVNALAFIPTAINIEVGAAGGTVNHSPAPGTGTISIYGGGTIGGGAIIGTGTLIKTGAGEFRYQGLGLPNTTYTKLDVRQGLFRLGFNSSISDERGFGAVPAAFTPDAITLSGGGSIATSFLAVDSVLHANRGVTLGAGGGQLLGPLTVTGAITGTGNLTTMSTVASNPVVLTGANDFTGATLVNTNVLALGTTANPSGAILSSSAITLNNVAVLSLINAAGNSNRLGDTIPITMNAGSNLSLGHNADTDTTETVGALTFASGTPILSVSSAAGRISTLTAASLSRGPNNATGLVRAANLSQTVTADVGRIMLADSGASLTLVGTNTLNNGAPADATPALKIVPYLFGDITATGLGSGFVTYDQALGLRVLTAAQTAAVSADYATAANPDNAAVSADTTLSSAVPLTVNSLLFNTGASVLNSLNPIALNVGSGAVATTGGFAHTIGSGFAELALGNAEGVITVPASTLTINTPVRVTNNGGLTKSGAGTLVLGAANAYTGTTRVNAGILQMNDAAALGTGAVTINGTRLAINGDFTVGNAITIGPNTGVAGNGLIQATSGTAIVSGPITVTHNASAGGHFAATGVNTLVLSGVITASPSVTLTSRIGTVVLSGGGTGYNAYQIQAGTVRVGADNGISATAVVDVASSDPATLDLNGFDQVLGGIARTSGTAGRNALVTNTGAPKTLILNVQGPVSYAGTIAATNTTGEAVIAGAISLIKTGPGIQSFSGAGANTYSGSTIVNGGVLRLSKAANTNVIPPGNSVAINGGGTLQVAADSQIDDSISSLSIDGGTLDLGTIIEGVTPAVVLTNGAIAGSASTGFLLARGGFVGNGTNTISKSLSVRGADSNSGLFDVVTGLTTVSGNIRSDDGSFQGVTKTGPGRLVLDGASSYNGPTTARAGTLIVSGSLSASSEVSVGDPIDPARLAVLGGSGSVGNVTASGTGSAATTGATIDPGNAPLVAGNLKTAGLNITLGAHLSLQIGGNTVGGESTTGYDRVTSNGIINVTGGDLKLTLQGAPTFTPGDVLYLVVNNGNNLVLGTFDTLNGSAFDPSDINLGGQAFQLDYNANFAGVDTDGLANDIALIAIPEPSAWMAILGGLGVLCGRRRPRLRD